MWHGSKKRNIDVLLSNHKLSKLTKSAIRREITGHMELKMAINDNIPQYHSKEPADFATRRKALGASTCKGIHKKSLLIMRYWSSNLQVFISYVADINIWNALPRNYIKPFIKTLN